LVAAQNLISLSGAKEDLLVNKANSKTIFFDDFGSPEIDPVKWNIRSTGKVVNNEQQAYVESAEVLYIEDHSKTDKPTSGGILNIHARYQKSFTTPDGSQFDFLSGRIDTRDRFDFRYGTVSARIKLPVGQGLWPAFWAMGYGEWPANGEIDIMEYVGAPDWISAGIHGPGYCGEEALVNQVYFYEPGQIKKWHIYSAVWEPDQFLFLMDGKLIYRVTREMANFFGPWVFNDPKYLILNLAIGGKYPFKIYGVREPYYGVPSDTVRNIQNNQARMLVDWVKVSRDE
jgi:beta-glucanase (GH16 family)